MRNQFALKTGALKSLDPSSKLTCHNSPILIGSRRSNFIIGMFTQGRFTLRTKNSSHAALKSVIGSINSSRDDLGLHYKEKRKVTKGVEVLKRPRNRPSG